MKTITISDEQYEKLEKIVEEMKTQNNRATQYPLFVVQEDQKVYGSSEWCNETERKEESDGELCESCKKLEEENGEIPEYCDDCDSECFVSFNWEDVFDLQAGVFFTAKECDEHIRRNNYHYTNPRSYGIGAWRNPEMQFIFKILFEITKKEIPSHYK